MHSNPKQNWTFSPHPAFSSFLWGAGDESQLKSGTLQCLVIALLIDLRKKRPSGQYQGEITLTVGSLSLGVCGVENLNPNSDGHP